MPQLNPSPWFFIMVITWTTLILIFMSKTLNSKHLKSPTQKEHETKTTLPWIWPWT